MNIKTYDWPAEHDGTFTIAGVVRKCWQTRVPEPIKYGELLPIVGAVIKVNGRPFKVWKYTLPLFGDSFFKGQYFHFMGDYLPE